MTTNAKHRRYSFIIFLSLAVFAHSSYSAEPVELKSRFTAKEVDWFTWSGSSSIRGNASIKLSNGAYKSCAGFTVELVPAAPYSDERILKTYGNNSAGQILMEQNPPKFTPDAPGYHTTVRKTKCDSEGNFAFNYLPKGEYYVIAFIIWKNEDSEELSGGGAMQRASITKDEKDVYINLTPQL